MKCLPDGHLRDRTKPFRNQLQLLVLQVSGNGLDG